MRKSRMLIFFIVFIQIIAIFLLLFLATRRSHSIIRELSQEEIKPTLKRITGRELPDKAEELKAILYSRAAGGLEHIFVSFQTDQKGCLYTLDTFGGQDVKREEFPQVGKNPFRWIRSGFNEGYRFQKKLGVVLFDKDLLDRIIHDFLECVKKGRYPKDAVTGYYLEFDASSKLTRYRVLVFKDQSLVYIFAEKKKEGIYLR